MNIAYGQPMIHWAREFLKDAPDTRGLIGASMYSGPEDVACLPILAQAIQAIGQRCEEGDRSVAARGYLAPSMIDKIIDGATVADVPEGVFWAVTRATSQFPSEAGELAVGLRSRPGKLQSRKQVGELLARLESGMPSIRKSILADVEGLLREYPDLRGQFRFPTE